jgi:hypothetical protein
MTTIVVDCRAAYHLVSDRQLLCLSRVFKLILSALFPVEALK